MIKKRIGSEEKKGGMCGRMGGKERSERGRERKMSGLERGRERRGVLQ